MRLALFLLAGSLAAADHKPVYPANAAKPVGPYTPGILAGDYLYVSGQGARDAKAQMPPTFEAQAKQCLENVKGVVQAAGLRLDNVVYTQVYLKDVRNYDALNKVWATYFPKRPPARSLVGVTMMPTDTPVEISAIAVRNQKLRRAAELPPARVKGAPISVGVLAGNRFFLGGIVGRDFAKNVVPNDPRAQVDLMIARASEVLAAANLGLRHLAQATIYFDSQLPRDQLIKILEEAVPEETATTIIQVASLPFGAHVEITGVASRDLKREGSCTSIGDTVYCPARAGDTSNVLDQLKLDLQAAKTGTDRVVASNVFVDHIDNFNAMNSVYAKYFGSTPPTRTTVQPSLVPPTLTLAPTTNSPIPKGEGPHVEISLIAIR
jgi:2-iminobutanoate/2-iminopropanoate deaminase